MASFETRGSSTRAIVWLPGGKKKTQSFSTLAEAEAWAAEAERRKAIGKLTAGTSVTCGDLWEAYLDAVASRTDTATFNRLRIMNWMADPLAKKRLSDVITHDINEWIDRRLEIVNERTKKTVSRATAERELNLMSASFTWAVKIRHWIEKNPCAGANRLGKTRPRNRRLLTAEEIQAICIATGYLRDTELKTITAKVGACFLLALETGMRSGEILRIRPVDYQRDRKVVHVHALEQGGRKTSRSGRLDQSRNVPLTDRAIDLLDQLLKARNPDQPYLVGIKDSQRDALWRKSVNLSGVEDLHFHDTKHEACTRLAQFLDVLDLSHAVGTKDIRLLRDVYYNVDAERSAKKLPPKLSLVA